MIDRKQLEKIMRFEVIDESGRAYVRCEVLHEGWNKKTKVGISLDYDIQDDGRTLKIFVKQRSPQSIAD